MEFVPQISDLPQPISPRLLKKEPRIEVGAELFKRFVLLRELGEGRCSTSWLVEDPRFRRDVVLKLFRSANTEETLEERTIWRDFLRRLRILNHPDIVITMEFFHEGSWLALSSIYEVGPNLASISLLDGKKLPLPETLAILKTVGSALAAAHDKFLIVHGNLNAYNILVPTKRSSAKITDFGFHPPVQKLEEAINNPELGWKLACLSPERLRGGAPSHADDIYAYATIAFQLFTGQNPPLDSSGAVDKNAADNLLAAAPAEWRKCLPAALSLLPKDRPRMISNLLQDLNIYEEFDPGNVDFLKNQSMVKAQERAKDLQKKKSRNVKSPDNLRPKATLFFRASTLLCIVAAPVMIGFVIYHNMSTENKLEAKRVNEEIQEKALEAQENAQVLELNDRLTSDFSPSQASLNLYREALNAPIPTPKPTPLVVNSGAKDFYGEGQTKLAAGDPAGAMESYELAIVLQPDWPDLLEARGTAQLAINNAGEAILEFNKALIIEPTRLISLLGRAQAHLATKDKTSALPDLQAVLKIDPENIEAKELMEKNDFSAIEIPTPTP